MPFGPFAQGRCFHIEESEVYEAIQNGVKMAEFLLLRTNDIASNNNFEIWIVEAKSSAPNHKNLSDFGKFIDEIKQKLINALSLGLASVLGRHPKAEPELPCAFKKINPSRVQVKFVVVMKEHPEKDLPPLKDVLEEALRPTLHPFDGRPPLHRRSP